MTRPRAHAPFLVSVVAEARRPVRGSHPAVAASDAGALPPVEPAPPREKHPERDVERPLPPPITAEAVTSRQPEPTGSVPGTPANPVSLPERAPAETSIPKIARTRAAHDRSDVVTEADEVVAAREQLPTGDSPSPGARHGASLLQPDVSVSSPRPATEHSAAAESFADAVVSQRSRRSTATGGEGWPASAARDADEPSPGEPAVRSTATSRRASQPSIGPRPDSGVEVVSGASAPAPAVVPSPAADPSARAVTPAAERDPLDPVRLGEVDRVGAPDRESPQVRIGHVEIVVTAAPRRTPGPEPDASLTSRKYLRRL